MVLVDTSVLIDFLRGRQNETTQKFDDLLSSRLPFGINAYIYQEVLQGAASESDFQKLKKYLDTQTIYALARGLASYAEAARIYFRCRAAGVSVRSTVDCLICQTAIENHLSLLHHDTDFTRIAQVVKELKIF